MQKKCFYCVFWNEKFLKVYINTYSILFKSDTMIACNFIHVC